MPDFLKRLSVLITLISLFGCMQQESSQETVTAVVPLTEEVLPEEESPQPQLYSINDSHVRFRKEPRLTDNIIRKFEEGEEAAVLARTVFMEKIGEDTAYWLKVKATAGETGWVFAPFVSMEKPETVNPDSSSIEIQLLKTTGAPADVKKSYTRQDTRTFIFSDSIHFYDSEDSEIEFPEKAVRENQDISIYLKDFFSGETRLPLAGHTGIYVHKDEILLSPAAVGILNAMPSDSPLFYEVFSSPASINTEKLSKTEIYSAYGMRYSGGGLYVSLSNYGNLRISGWLGADLIRADVFLSRRETAIDRAFLFEIPVRIPELNKLYGEPVKELVRYVVNRHDPDQEDVISLLQYKGFTVEIYHAVKSDKYLMLDINVTSPELPVHPDLRIGTPIENIISLMGVPDMQKDDFYRFNIYSDFEDIGYLYLTADSENRVKSVGCRYFIS
ncbi:MAG: SH3 domain-containing protein [Spirochaetales bacterium]|nr:SH3 domain-containing protein [Spirochaetales bacterium]